MLKAKGIFRIEKSGSGRIILRKNLVSDSQFPFTDKEKIYIEINTKKSIVLLSKMKKR